MYRDSSQFKLTNALIGDDSNQEIRSQGTELNHTDWRQGILMNAGSHAEAEEITSRPGLKAERANSNPEPSKVPKAQEPGARPKQDRQRSPRTMLFKRTMTLCIDILFFSSAVSL